MMRGARRRMSRIERRPWLWAPATGGFGPEHPGDRVEYLRLVRRSRELGELFGRVARERAHIPYRTRPLGRAIITVVDVNAGVMMYTAF